MPPSKSWMRRSEENRAPPEPSPGESSEMRTWMRLTVRKFWPSESTPEMMSLPKPSSWVTEWWALT